MKSLNDLSPSAHRQEKSDESDSLSSASFSLFFLSVLFPTLAAPAFDARGDPAIRNFSHRCCSRRVPLCEAPPFAPKKSGEKRKKKKAKSKKKKKLTPRNRPRSLFDLQRPGPRKPRPRQKKKKKKGKLPSPPSFLPGQPWFDSDGNIIQAHGGSALKTADGTYWWYGEDKSGASYETAPGGHWRVDTVGVAAYWSRDLITWHRAPKLALAAVPEIPDLHPKTSILERPKVVYNAKTKK